VFNLVPTLWAFSEVEHNGRDFRGVAKLLTLRYKRNKEEKGVGEEGNSGRSQMAHRFEQNSGKRGGRVSLDEHPPSADGGETWHKK
jgi:hypothetical protein